MQQTMKEKIQAKLKNSEGFTLLEILVVLTIMGFLIAMVAPRLAGISGGAVDTVCDSNQNRMIQMVSAYVEKTGKFPNKMTNIVVQNGVTGTGTYEIPTVVDGNPDNGREVLAEEFVTRVKPVIHILTDDEVEELADMGIKRVFNLNAYDGSTIAEADQQSAMAEVTLEGGMGVMMSGIGYAAEAAATDASYWTGTDTLPATTATDLIGYGEANFLGRIIFGFGPENGLVTSGLISNAAHCPGGIQDSDNVVYNDYNLVVPRLQATVDRPSIADRATGPNGIQYVAYGYAEDFATTGSVGSTVDATTGEHTAIAAGLKARTLNYAAQQVHEYATMCPEGHMFPADDSDFWAVDLAAGGVTINP